MLGLARASEYAGWWNAGGPVVIDIDVVTAVSQAAYQTPVFSWNAGNFNVTGGFQRPSNSGAPALNVSGYDSLTGFNSVKQTFVCTWQPKWDTGLTSATQKFRFSIDNNASPAYDQAINAGISSGKMNIGAGSINASGGPGDGLDLPGVYSDYIDTWLTVVWCQSNSSSDYTNWTGTGTGTCYTRLAVYNTQTGVLIKKNDIAQSAGTFPDIGSMITNSGGTVDIDTGATYNVGWDWSPADATYENVLGQSWISLGTMFDPESVKATDSTWLTTRPSATIGTGKAWLNWQFTEYEFASGTTYYLTDTSDDLLTGSTNDRQAQLAPYGSTPSVTDQFNFGYSTTNIPKDTS